MSFNNYTNDLFNKNEHFLDDFVSRFQEDDNDSTLSDQYAELEFDHKGKPNASVQYDKRLDNVNNPYGSYSINKHQDFTHNNMMPSYAAGSYGAHNYNISDRKIELFNGLDSNPQYKKKQEATPLFSPESRREEFTNGVPSQTDFMKTRYIPSDKRQGERPVEQIRVAPGLNLGYNQHSTHGYQDLYRALPKNIDDLRPISRPKITYKKPVVQSGKHGDRRSKIGAMEQNKPDTFFSVNEDSLMPTYNARAAPTITGVIRNDPTNRAKETTNLNPAKSIVDKHTPEDLQQKNRSSNRISYDTDGPRNVTNDTKGTITTRGSYNPSDTNRNMTEDNKNIIGMQGNKFMMNLVNFTNLIPNINKRQTTQDTHITNASNLANNVQSYLHNSIATIPDQTLRNIIENNIHITNQSGNQQHTKLFNFDNNVKDQNNRNMTENTVIINALSNHQQTYLFNNLNNIPDMNLRSLVNQIWNTNLSGNKSQTKAFNYENATPDTTMREFIENNQHLLGANPANKTRSKAFNYDDTAKTTHRQRTENNDHITNTKNPNQNVLFDYNNSIPDRTNREEETKTITAPFGKDSLKSRAIQEFENALLNESKNTAQYKLSLRNPITVENQLGYQIHGGPTALFSNFTFTDDSKSFCNRTFDLQ